MIKFKAYHKNIFLTIGTLITSIFIAMLLLVLVYSLPTSSISLNVGNSLDIYTTEREYFRWAPEYAFSQMDNYTDTLMLSQASYSLNISSDKGIKNIIKDSLLNPRYIHKDNDRPLPSLIQYFKQADASEFYRSDYARYWHGYLIFLKPLLTLFTMSDIRMFNMVAQFLLLFVLMTKLYAKGGYKLSMPFLVGIIVLNPISCALAMQYASLYYIILFSCLVMLKYNLYISDRFWYFFLLIGICTSFFDLLTYPLATLGFPLILYILLNDEELFPKIKKVIISSISWGTGYVGMWFGKWGIASLITGQNILINAYNQLRFRMDGANPWNESTLITFSTSIQSNLDIFNNSVCMLICEIFLMLLIDAIFFNKQYKIKFKKSVFFPLLFVGTYPFVWYSIVKNHSIIHPWMTHRILAITILALVYMAIYSFEKKIPRK